MFDNTFNLNSANRASVGAYDFTFFQPMQSTAYQIVVGNALASGGVPLLPVVSNKTVNGFRLTFYNGSGAATDIATGICDILVSGGN